LTARNAIIPLNARRRKLAFPVVLPAAVGDTLIFAVMPPLLPAMAVDFGGGLSGFLLVRFGMRGTFGLAGIYGAVTLAALAGAIFGIVTLARHRLTIAVHPRHSTKEHPDET